MQHRTLNTLIRPTYKPLTELIARVWVCGVLKEPTHIVIKQQ